MARRNRVERKPLEIKNEAEILKLQRVVDWSIDVGHKDEVCAYVFSHFDNGEKLLGELKNFIEGLKKPANKVYNVKSYLEHVRSINGLVGKRSLETFSTYLINTQSNANTAYMVFIDARSYVKHLISAEVVAKQSLPEPPERVEVESKETFYELVAKLSAEQLDVIKSFASEIRDYQDKFDIDEISARALFYSDYCMQKIHKLAIEKLNVAIEEMLFVDSIVDELTDEEIEQLKAVVRFSEFSAKQKSRALCVKILYSIFGYQVPPSGKWPKGISDWVKRHWSIRKLRSAFFPDTECHKHMLVAMLSHKELMPNVDSVFYYSFINCITPSIEPGKVNVFMGKLRGKGVEEELSVKDPLVSSLLQYIEIFKKKLNSSDKGRAELGKENLSIFTHYFSMRGVSALKTYDPSSASDFVRSALDSYVGSCELLSLLNCTSVTGENFRPTQSAILKLKKTPQRVIKKKMGHSESSTTSGYTDRVETSTLLKDKQKSFQEYIVEQSRVPQEKLEQPLDSIIDTSEIEDSKRFIFSDVQQVAEWIAFRDKIYMEKDRLSISNPVRWVCHWMVKLAEFEALLSLVKRTDYGEAKKLAELVELPYLD